MGYARHYRIAQKSLDSGCIVLFVSEANIISVFLQETQKSSVSLIGTIHDKHHALFGRFYTLTHWESVRAEVR